MSEEYNASECYNCRFFDPITKDFEEGYCRRYPPVYVSAMATTSANDLEESQQEHASSWVWRFPVVSADGSAWCGEFQKHPMAPDGPSEWRHEASPEEA
jgi:hypothetical protein